MEAAHAGQMAELCRLSLGLCRSLAYASLGLSSRMASVERRLSQARLGLCVLASLAQPELNGISDDPLADTSINTPVGRCWKSWSTGKIHAASDDVAEDVAGAAPTVCVA